MSEAAKLSPRMSVDEFLDWDAGDGRVWQLVDGEPQAMAPASIPHGILQAELARLFVNHFRAQGSRCFAVAAPGVTPRVRASQNMRVPDLAVSCAEHDRGARSLSDPVLVVELLSPSNHQETWANVWAYTSIPSVHEVLVLHTVRIAADLLRRNPDGTWPAETVPLTAGDLVLDSIGVQVPLADIYRDTHLGPRPA